MVSPLQVVLDHRGGFAAVSHRSSARGRPSNLGLAAVLDNPDVDSIGARYGVELRTVPGYGFQVVREQCVVTRPDSSSDWFDRRPVNGSIGWKPSARSLDPVVEPDALALPLIGGDARFRPVLRFLSDMRICRIEPAAVRALQDPDGGVRLQADGSNAASVLREIQRKSAADWQRIGEFLESVVPGTVGVHLRRRGNKLTLGFSQEWGELATVKFDAFNMSDGTLRVLGMLAAIFQRPAPSLLLIEDPEATVHPRAIGSILDVLRHAGRFMQVVATTHSPDVLDATWLQDRHIRVASWRNGTTRVSALTVSEGSPARTPDGGGRVAPGQRHERGCMRAGQETG